MPPRALGYVASAEGDLDAVRAWHAEALAAARSTADAPVLREALAGLADLALVCSGDAEAIRPAARSQLGMRGALDRSAIAELAVAAQARGSAR